MPPLSGAALDAAAKTAKAKLQAALQQHAGPRDDYFVKQSQHFGGEPGEDADGNKKAKGGKKLSAKAAPADSEFPAPGKKPKTKRTVSMPAT